MNVTETLARLDAQGLRRHLRSGGSGTQVDRDGQLINLASNDTLGLSTDPRVIEALCDGAARFGVGASASRLVSGNHLVHEELEADIARLRGTEAALVFSSGYAANVGVLSTLCGRHDVVFADALIHASLLDGIALSGARLVRYRHADVAHLAELIASEGGHQAQRFIVSEGIFSMDADIADLPALVRLAQDANAILVIDDAHGSGTFGSDGRGTVAALVAAGSVPVQLGTLSKAYGTQGGFVAGDRNLIDLLVNRARSFVFSTGISPALASAAREGLRRAEEDGWRRESLARHTAALRTTLTDIGRPPLGDARAPMVPVVVDGPEQAVAISAKLQDAGVLAPAIRPPAVPTSRIRFAPMATHTPEQIERSCEVIREVFA